MPCPGCSGDSSRRVRPYKVFSNADLFADMSIVECSLCGLGFTSPAPSDGSLAEYYKDGWYDRERGEDGRHRSMWELYTARADAQFRWVMAHKGADSWLDVGAGHGYLLDRVAQRGDIVTGAVEPGPERRKSLAERGHQLVDLENDSGLWDVISFSHVLEHVADPRAFLGQLRTRLNPAGIVFCEVPNIPTPGRDSKYDEPHVLFFSNATLLDIFTKSGFSAEALTTSGPRLDRRVNPRLRRLEGKTRYLAQKRFQDGPVLRLLHQKRVYRESGSGRAWLRLIARAA